MLYLFQVASALHDNCRAVLVGKRTYGKVHNFFLIFAKWFKQCKPALLF